MGSKVSHRNNSAESVTMSRSDDARISSSVSRQENPLNKHDDSPSAENNQRPNLLPVTAPTHCPSSVHRKPEAFAAAVLIQTWYRRYVSRLEIRRRCAWQVLQILEQKATEQHVPEMEMTVNAMNKYFSDIRSSTNVTEEGDCTGFPLTELGFAQLLQSFQTGKQCSSAFVAEVLQRSSAACEQQPNLIRIDLNELKPVVVVCGDIHGNLPALLCLFEQNGLPSDSNRIIFNGDFVDRGSHSVEVLVLLLTAFLVYPECVWLTRGNHEDVTMNELYGFKKEVHSKYPVEADRIFSLCSNLFRLLPLGCLIHDTVLVCHGGIAESTDLRRLETLNRQQFTSIIKPVLQGTNAADLDDWQQVLNLLWSDPQQKKGCRLNNNRGGGCLFGPDVTHAFLAETGLQLIIRSHECFPEGWRLLHSGSVLSVFTSFDYYGENSNAGAFARLAFAGSAPKVLPESSPALAAAVHRQILRRQPRGESLSETLISVQVIQLSRGHGKLEADFKSQPNAIDTVESAFLNLWFRLMQHKAEVLSECQCFDQQATGKISLTYWCRALTNTTCLRLPWRCLRHYIVKTETTGDHPISVLYKSMFQGPCITNSRLPDHSRLASELFVHRDTLRSIMQLGDPQNTGKVNLTKIRSWIALIALRNAKATELHQCLEELIHVLDRESVEQFNYCIFLNSFRFVEVRQRNLPD